MEIITDIALFNMLINTFRQSHGSDLRSNLPVFKNVLEEPIREGRLCYKETEDCIYFFQDEKDYYVLFFISEKGIGKLEIPELAKEVLVNENYFAKNGEIDVRGISNYDLYIGSGFFVESVNYQMVIDPLQMKEKVSYEYDNCKKILEENGLVITDCPCCGNEAIKRLWRDNLKLTDVPCDHHYKGNYIIIKDKDETVAAGWYDIVGQTSNLRHIVVEKAYRGKRLSKVLNYFWLHTVLQQDVKRGITWIEEKNSVSFIVHEKIGFRKNNRLSVQFIFNKCSI